MERRERFITALAVSVFILLVVTASPVLAYFSDHTEATGKVPVELGFETEMKEEVDGFVKTVRITNQGPEGCFVRARAYSADSLKLSYKGSGWTRGESDDWYYYDKVVEAGEETAPLEVSISDVPENAEEGDSFNVVVVYESTKALYGEDGKPLQADWAMKAAEGSDN